MSSASSSRRRCFMTPNRVIAGRQPASSVSVWPSRSKSRSSSLRRLTSASALNTGSTSHSICDHSVTCQGCSNYSFVPKVTFIGAGSAVFARQLMTDILAIDGLDEGTFALVDLDAERLGLAKGIADRLVELSGKRWQIEASTQRLDVLAGTDYVINSI